MNKAYIILCIFFTYLVLLFSVRKKTKGWMEEEYIVDTRSGVVDEQIYYHTYNSFDRQRE
jgi:hypothetical protein